MKKISEDVYTVVRLRPDELNQAVEDGRLNEVVDEAFQTAKENALDFLAEELSDGGAE